MDARGRIVRGLPNRLTLGGDRSLTASFNETGKLVIAAVVIVVLLLVFKVGR